MLMLFKNRIPGKFFEFGGFERYKKCTPLVSELRAWKSFHEAHDRSEGVDGNP